MDQEVSAVINQVSDDNPEEEDVSLTALYLAALCPPEESAQLLDAIQDPLQKARLSCDITRLQSQLSGRLKSDADDALPQQTRQVTHHQARPGLVQSHALSNNLEDATVQDVAANTASGLLSRQAYPLTEENVMDSELLDALESAENRRVARTTFAGFLQEDVTNGPEDRLNQDSLSKVEAWNDQEAAAVQQPPSPHTSGGGGPADVNRNSMNSCHDGAVGGSSAINLPPTPAPTPATGTVPNSRRMSGAALPGAVSGGGGGGGGGNDAKEQLDKLRQEALNLLSKSPSKRQSDGPMTAQPAGQIHGLPGATIQDAALQLAQLKLKFASKQSGSIAIPGAATASSNTLDAISTATVAGSSVATSPGSMTPNPSAAHSITATPPATGVATGVAGGMVSAALQLEMLKLKAAEMLAARMGTGKSASGSVSSSPAHLGGTATTTQQSSMMHSLHPSQLEQGQHGHSSSMGSMPGAPGQSMQASQTHTNTLPSCASMPVAPVTCGSASPSPDDLNKLKLQAMQMLLQSRTSGSCTTSAANPGMDHMHMMRMMMGITPQLSATPGSPPPTPATPMTMHAELSGGGMQPLSTQNSVGGQNMSGGGGGGGSMGGVPAAANASSSSVDLLRKQALKILAQKGAMSNTNNSLPSSVVPSSGGAVAPGALTTMSGMSQAMGVQAPTLQQQQPQQQMAALPIQGSMPYQRVWTPSDI